MRNGDFVQNKALFSFNAAECLRNAYFHNTCTLCIDLCPKDALLLVRNKLTLMGTECIECAACIGSCPTEALDIESFDPNAFTMTFQEQENKILSCQSNTPCLGVFDTPHYITMALQSDEAPRCDLSHCEGCRLNDGRTVEQTIRHKIVQSNDFLEHVGMEARSITIKETSDDEADNARRALFRTAWNTVHEVIRDNEEQEPAIMTRTLAGGKTALPLKYTLLKNSIKEHIGQFSTTRLEGVHPLFFNKRIDFEACTNCGDCIQFCPTEALFATSDRQGIIFKSGMCIGCGICDDICKSSAIGTETGLDLVAVAFDRAEELVHYEMVMCHECRCPYPYKGGDPLCERCKTFHDNFETMFILAKDQ